MSLDDLTDLVFLRRSDALHVLPANHIHSLFLNAALPRRLRLRYHHLATTKTAVRDPPPLSRRFLAERCPSVRHIRNSGRPRIRGRRFHLCHFHSSQKCVCAQSYRSTIIRFPFESHVGVAFPSFVYTCCPLERWRKVQERNKQVKN